ncbi:major facilitator superfamily transporter [Colletotrichum incanum]|nr:major facilitator superfamily transporter [Colletotrichum incanum]
MSDTVTYPGPAQLALTMFALFMGMFTANLDSTILATAIPKITEEFRSLSDIGWHGSSGFLTFAAFQTSWGKVFKNFHLKWSYLFALFIFELGSLICVLAPNSAALIAGRSVTGVGGAGLCTGTFAVIGYTVRPERQPAFMGVMGATYALASFVGPIDGGTFSEYVSVVVMTQQEIWYATWRWCFWVNLPIGAVAAIIIVVFFGNPSHAKPIDVPWREKNMHLDLSGCALVL